MDRWSRFAPLCGIIFVALLVASFAIPSSSPGVKASGQHVINFYTAHRNNERTGGFLGFYGVIFFLFFASALRGYLRRARPETTTLAAMSLGGAVLLAAGGAILSSLQIALSDAPGKLSPGAAQALNVLSNDTFIPLVAGGCVFMIANGLAAIRWGVLPAWLGWIAILIGFAAVTPVGFFGFLALMAWVLVVSVLLVVRNQGEVPRRSTTRPVTSTT